MIRLPSETDADTDGCTRNQSKKQDCPYEPFRAHIPKTETARKIIFFLLFCVGQKYDKQRRYRGRAAAEIEEKRAKRRSLDSHENGSETECPCPCERDDKKQS